MWEWISNVKYNRKDWRINEKLKKKAINDCIQQGILADYLKHKGSEVTNMLIAEYSYEEDIQVK